MDFKKEFSNRLDFFNQSLNEVINREIGDKPTQMQTLIWDSIKYSVLNSGKRIRPIILLEIAKILNADIDRAKILACSLEMIHTYSLIHDDLPAMDDDDLRRGKPSNHIVYGEDMAILAGDALLNTAYEIMFKYVLKDVNQSSVNACMSIVNAAGVHGMILGQVSDIKIVDRDINSLNYINLHKTGDMIRASFVSAGYLAEYDDMLTLCRIGENLGSAFQIQDDVLDVVGDEKNLGKPIGSDKFNNKLTYVDLLGLDECIAEYKKLYDLCIDDISSLPNNEFLIELVKFLMNRTN